METTSFNLAMRAYEKGRWAQAVQAALPVLVIPLVSFFVGGRAVSHAWVGGALFALVAVFLWRGQGWSKGASVGLKVGLIPLVLAHAAQLYGHICTPTGCTTLCVPACAAGGLIAGGFVARMAKKSPAPAVTLLGAGAVTFLTGSLGCACVGWGGMLGLVAGLAISVFVTVRTASFQSPR